MNRDSLVNWNLASIPDDEDPISISILYGLHLLNIPDGGGFAEAENLNASPGVCILSIDGGGIRGIIVAIMLCHSLQELDDPDARIADYFDMIAVTSSGGLITAMLTCPDENGRPKFTTEEILDFYLKERPEIFPQTWHLLAMFTSCFRGPKYDGEHLRSIIMNSLREKRLRDTVTDVVIVAYDTRKNDPVIFSSHEMKNSPYQGPSLSDICIGASAAPTFFPPHHFEATDPSGNVQEYNLVDGALAANNPILLAIRETVRKVTGGANDSAEARKHGDFSVLSIGTGTKRLDGHRTSETQKWGWLRWGKNIVDMLLRGSEAMVEETLHTYIKTLGAEYLRIQAHDLDGDISSLDIATPENLADLMTFGNELLKTYAEDLTRLAEQLSEARKSKLARANLSSLDKATPKNLDDLVIFSELLGKQLSQKNANIGVLESCTDAEALDRFAKLRSEGRKSKLALSPCESQPDPSIVTF